MRCRVADSSLSVEQAGEELKARTLDRATGDGVLDAEPEVLYHYTSLDSARKILESTKIWASRVHFLNDSSQVA